MGFMCFQHEDSPAVLLVTNLETGDTLAVGTECLLDWTETFGQQLRDALPVETEAEPPTAVSEPPMGVADGSPDGGEQSYDSEDREPLESASGDLTTERG